MFYTEMTKLAMRVAYNVHHGMVDKGGVPYIFHPMHLAEQCQTEAQTVVALLRDVVEDTELTLESLTVFGFPADIIHAVDCITRREGEAYHDYIERVAQDPTASYVKQLDLQHNLQQERCPDMPESQCDRYAKALRRLMALGGSQCDKEA